MLRQKTQMKSFDYLKDKGIQFEAVYLKEVPRTAQDVERLFGCPLEQVLKTLLFIGEKNPILTVLSGDKKVSLKKLENLTGQKVLRMAKPNEVKELTGYPVGGVCPFAIDNDTIQKVIDEKVFTLENVNIGSGKAEIGIELASEDLKRIWDGKILNISE
ncbi:hypothetical protein A3G67_02130 [Candidatus Roizmanbacteria bacterium RIFCSPLOWO2_12_FULL_40_12]|uniref:YbaK/aminoacyl-tRNA synthetase-associated domain-containing protein n=1 Tax=Candidatus Roizmanbacteria bacterium RIFCSPLOWO2_01_FULL_40_42 TaxID=1802066 RepID=A0A1F7J3M7_9BACT|nr:MAG: hypothetical protein A2779_01250 [Candidatus Roizmanbacteria bacterium RIFCSPHIGHO2_01_FULL_40_98]OGK28989.1 MAG: hypothetical protein A3C31_01890 [Candidatus Roizmanbacteria bacterium RIFCSPHIGHO2_02_FULL_40_53]OGK29545.1 MAG: hypothetical protein A2W49_03650 [Candidatus Roizmanbacteria bacterium RIFCSPHIGHO2_12_41_18]OGK37276.1 MAG: hypothetical protein A3E69_04190 [Candidatus Roizmanbacteria bacterium RIFCSPHIGHO2_12_FULL_40_130]OGK50218.1 MAG: hypothetical protein A3B50_00345 [Candi